MVMLTPNRRECHVHLFNSENLTVNSLQRLQANHSRILFGQNPKDGKECLVMIHMVVREAQHLSQVLATEQLMVRAADIR